MNRKKLSNLLSVIVLVFLAFYLAYTKGWIFADFKSLSPSQANELIASTHPLIVDVRTPEEFASGHLKGALSLPLQEMGNNPDLLSPFRAKRMIVYCRSGHRSIAASRLLLKHGAVPLNMNGGIEAWKAQGLPTVH